MGSSRGLVPLLAAFTSLVVLTTDVYLPVLPRLGADLATSPAAAAGTVSAVLIGIAAGQLLIGPLSDATGRRRLLLLGAAGYALTHVLSAVAPNITVLLISRVFTGLATAACMVVARAMVADVYAGPTAARAYATLGAITAIAPVAAPMLGGLLARVTSWRGMFLVLAVTAALLTVVGWRLVPETLPRERRLPPHLGRVVRELFSLTRHRGFLAYLATFAAVGAVLFGYIGGSSFLLQGSFGLSPQQFSLVFATNSIGIFAMSWTTRHIVGRVGPRRLLHVGQLSGVLGAAVLALGVAVSALPVVLTGLFIAVATLSVIMSTGTALGMEQAPGRAGSAAGLLGIGQFTVGAIASPLAGLGGSAWSFVVVIGVGATAGLVLRLVLMPRPTTGSR